MKKRDDIQTFHNSARIAVGSTRILTPPQQQMSTQNVSSTSAAPSQYQILNVLRDAGGNITQTQNIQYTYSSPAISAASNMQKSNIVQPTPQQNQQTVHVVNAANINISNRTKPSNSGTVTPTPIVTSPAGASSIQASIQAPNMSGQNFPRLKVEDALSYLDQVIKKFFLKFNFDINYYQFRLNINLAISLKFIMIFWT